jgi:putative membrane protein
MTYGGDFGWMAGFGGMGFGMVLGLLVWIGLIVLVVWGTTAAFGRTPADTRTDALDILKRRFAAGEITQPEFETARRALAA